MTPEGFVFRSSQQVLDLFGGRIDKDEEVFVTKCDAGFLEVAVEEHFVGAHLIFIAPMVPGSLRQGQGRSLNKRTGERTPQLVMRGTARTEGL